MARNSSRRGAASPFPGRGALIGMVHLPPLPGSPRAKLGIGEIVDRAVGEAKLLATAGFDALIVENYGDVPFFAETAPPETVAAIAVVAAEVVRQARVPVGVNLLRNDAAGALAAAAASGAAFVRVNVLSGVYATDQGVVTGRAAEVARLRVRLCPRVRIAADVHVKHAVPLSQPEIGQAAEDTAYRALADVLIVSGAATGKPADAADLRRVRAAVPDRLLWVGSGVTAATARSLLRVADGLIVGTCLKRGGRTEAALDPARVRTLVRAARG